MEKHGARVPCENNKRYNNSQFRNKFNQLRTQFHDFRELLQVPGVNWDTMLNTVSVPENLWELYLKMHKKAERFQKKGCPMINELEVIFNNQMVNFKDVYPLTEYPLVEEDILDLEDSLTNATSSAFLGESYDEEDYASLNIRRCQGSPTPISYLEGKREAGAPDIVEGSRE